MKGQARPGAYSRVRLAVLTVSTALFPVSFYYLSPVIPLMGSAQGIVTGSLVVFGVLFLASMVLGRVFCSWLCPAGGLQDQVMLARSASVAPRKIGWIKFIVWGSWVVVLLLLFREAGGVQGIEFAFSTEGGLSTTSVQALVVYSVVVLSFLALALIFGRRAGCHTVCWISPFMILGSRLGRGAGVPCLHVATKPELCNSCGSCVAACPMSLDVRSLAARGPIVDDDCILCARCVSGCPTQTLALRFGGRS